MTIEAPVRRGMQKARVGCSIKVTRPGKGCRTSALPRSLPRYCPHPERDRPALPSGRWRSARRLLAQVLQVLRACKALGDALNIGLQPGRPGRAIANRRKSARHQRGKAKDRRGSHGFLQRRVEDFNNWNT